MPRPSKRATVFLNLSSGLLLVGSGIWAGMVLPQQLPTQPLPAPQPQVNTPPEQPVPTPPPLLPTLSPPQASPAAVSPTADAASPSGNPNHEGLTDLEREIRELRQQVIQLLIRIEELESRLQRLSSQAVAPEPRWESATAAEIAPEGVSVPAPSATPTPTSFQVGTRTISLPGDLLFDFDKAEIRPEAASLLAQVAKSLEAMPGARVQVNGHTDNIGSLNYNLALSLRRANAVKDYLMKLLPEGHPISWTTSGFGPTLPVADNDTEAGRQRNRRVDLIIAP